MSVYYALAHHRDTAAAAEERAATPPSLSELRVDEEALKPCRIQIDATNADDNDGDGTGFVVTAVHRGASVSVTNKRLVRVTTDAAAESCAS